MSKKYKLLNQPIPGHYNYIMSNLFDRYNENNFLYVLILHLNQTKHYICGLFNDLRECLMVRYYMNSSLLEINDNKFFQAHHKDGAVIEYIYNIKTDSIDN